MYVAYVDAKILTSPKTMEMKDEYEKRFGERFIEFNYVDFHREGEKPAAQIYRETLERALEKGEPYHIHSKRYDFFDH